MAMAVETQPITFTEYRCKCGWLAFKAFLLPGACVQVRCKRCREIVTVKAE